MSSVTHQKRERRYASLSQGADHLQVSERTLRRMIASGEVSGYRLGKRLIRVDLNEIDAFMTPVVHHAPKGRDAQ